MVSPKPFTIFPFFSQKPLSSSFLSNWIPQNCGWEKLGACFLTDGCCADFVESPLAEDSDQKDSSTCVETDINCALSNVPGDISGKDSAVVSEVDFKMSSECSDSDLDMLRRNKHRLESRDIGRSTLVIRVLSQIVMIFANLLKKLTLLLVKKYQTMKINRQSVKEGHQQSENQNHHQR